MIARVHDYADDVCSGKIITGPHVRDACARHLRELDTLSDRYFFDQEAADRVCAFFPIHLSHFEGEAADQPFELLDWQQFVGGSLYGWKRYDNGKRRFRRAYIETGKGSGKSPFSGGLGIYATCADGERGSQGYVAARKAEQALVTFYPIAEMIKRSPQLAPFFTISGGDDYPHNARYKNGPNISYLRRVTTNKEGKGQSGPKPHFNLIDEYHEHDTANMLNFLFMGTKSRPQPLTIVITNAGSDPLSPCGQEHAFAIKVANEEATAESYFSYVCALDEDDEPFHDEKCWIKTNPSLPHTPGYEAIRDQINSVIGMSSRSLIERLYFCIWTEAVESWIDRDIWISCERKKIPKKIKEAPCYGALDIGLKKDLCAGALVWDFGENGNGSKHYAARLCIWTPADTLAKRAVRDGMPYEQWADDGFLVPVPGKALRLEWVAKWIGEQMEQFDLKGLAYDPYKIDMLEEALDDAGIYTTRNPLYVGDDKLLLASHPQGFIAGMRKVRRKQPDEVALWMPRSIDSIEDGILNGAIEVEFNPALRRAALGAIVINDASDNRRFNKSKATARIDPIVALAMAKGFADVELPEPQSVTLSDLTMGQIK